MATPPHIPTTPTALDHTQTAEARRTSDAAPDSLDAPVALDSLERALAGVIAPPQPTQPDRDEALEGVTIAGKYKLLRQLGSGGMGQVYLAEHIGTGGLVAVKRLRGAPGAKALRRFQLEAQNAASLQHANNIRVTDYGEDDTTQQNPYLVMEYVQGRALDTLLDAEGPMPWRRASKILQQVLQALWEAHESPRKIIHRDIKPANLLVCDLPGSPDHVKVLDYGISRALGAGGADTQGTVGSPHTMAPEQWEGRSVDARTDLYAVGCTAYQMLCGHPVFQTDSLGSLGYHHIHLPPPPLTEQVQAQGDKHIPAAFIAWIARLLSKDPEDRYPSASAALAALVALTDSPESHDSAHNPTYNPHTAEALTLTPATPPQKPALGRYVVWGAAGVLVAFVLIAVVALLAVHPPTPDTAQNTPSAQAESPPAFRHCTPDEAICKTKLNTDAQPLAWCAPSGQKVACCPEGLVPDGEDGACACAPGGVSTSTPHTNSCDRAPDDQITRAELKRVMSEQAGPQARRCYELGLADAPLSQGSISFHFDIGPRGEVHNARISEGAFPDPTVQRCILDVLRALRFAPPPNGWLTINYPFHLKSAE